MSLFELVLLLDQYRRRWSWYAGIEWFWSKGGATLTTVKRGAYQFYQTIVFDVSGRGHDEVAVRKLAGMKSDGRFVIDSRHCFARALDRTAKRGTRGESGVEKL